MRTFRNFIHGTAGRGITAVLIALSTYLFTDPYNYLYAVEAQRAKEAEIREIAKRMHVDPEFLLHPDGRHRWDFSALFARVARALGFPVQANEATPPADINTQIAQTKSRYALVAADTTLSKLAELMELSLASAASRGKKKKQIKAEMESVLRLVDKDFLPTLPGGLPSVAASRDAQTRAALTQLRGNVKAILNAPHALDEANIDQTLGQLRTAIGGQLNLRRNGNPRWAKDPFPLRDAYKKTPVTPIDRQYGSTATAQPAPTPAVVATAVPAKPALRPAANAIAPEITALAQQLQTPAKAFSFVYDSVDWQSYGGVIKGALGTFEERSGNDWDQALLLRDLLQAQGYQAQMEWGKVSLPIARAMNLAGTEDPMQAANLLATAGFDSVALTQNGSPVAVQMTHAWVRALIPYVPNRGTTAGAADTWVRMDPSFKKYTYQAGISIPIAWDENEYLQTSAVRPPEDFYGDKLWAYIRANNLNCNNLSQVPKTGAVQAAKYPFVPATLNARIEQLYGLAAQPPSNMLQTVSLTVTDPMWGDVLVSYSANLVDLWGKKLSITFPPATADDAAIIASYGGLYNTPAYLVHLKAVVTIDDQVVAEGGSIGAGADLSLDLQFREPKFSDTAHHDVVAGESMTEVFDGGRAPDALIATRVNRLQQMTATPPTNDDQRNAILTEKLNLIGLRYMQEVDDAFEFAAGMRWQRWVKSAFEGLVSQQIQVSYNFIGTPIRLTPADHNIDVTRVVVGIIPIQNDVTPRLNAMALAGLHSSYLEGAIWEEMEAQQGISATKALLLSRMAGQQLYTANQTNVDSVLAAINLSAEAESEIRGAVAQGRIAIVPSAPIRLNKWVGTGFILRDPIGGSAVYPITGGFAGGSGTGGSTSGTSDTLGNESSLGSFDQFLDQVIAEAGFANGLPPGPVQFPESMYGDPVNVATGNMFRSFDDLKLMALQPVTVDRVYNSRSSYNGPFGYGWTSFLDERLETQGDGSVVWRQLDGTEHRFTRNADGTYTAPPSIHWTLTMGAGGGTLTSYDGFVRAFDAAGRSVRNTDPEGNDVLFVRDGAGNVQSVVDAAGRTLLTVTMTNGKITGMADFTGRTLAYAYDGDDLVAFTDPMNHTWTYSYDLHHNLTAVADPLGNTQSYDYDTDDRLMHHVDAAGAEELFHYDIAGRTTVVTDKRGGDRMWRYDDQGRATLEADPAGNMATSTWDGAGNRTSTVDSRGYTTTYTYDANGGRTSTSRPDGTSDSTTYDDHGHALVERDAAGGVTTNVYDGQGNVLQTSRTVGGTTLVTTNTYDAHGRVLTTTDPNGGVSRMTYDVNGALLTRTDAANRTFTYTLDALGRTTDVRDAAGNVTHFTYDANDRRTSTTDPYGRVSTVLYDAAGRISSFTTPEGTTTYTWDGEGRMLAQKDPLGFTKKNTYDAAGNVIASEDRRGSVTRFEYDPVGRVRKKTDPDGGVWSYDWCAGVGSSAGSSCATCSKTGGDSFCLLVDPNGNKIVQEFDKLGRVTKVVDTLGNSKTIQYDALGLKTAETDANGNTTRYTYDEGRRLVKVTQPNNAVTTFTYDGNGNKLTQTDANNHTWTFVYDALNRLLSETDPLTRQTSYTYDLTGNLATKTDPDNKTTTYSYTVGRLTGIAYPDGTSESFTYDAVGRRATASNASATLTYTYDADNRVATIRNSKNGGTIAYEYDGEGNRTKMTTVKGAVTYAYDNASRLISMTDPVFGQFRFTYDSAGRRSKLQYPNGVQTTYQYDQVNRLTTLSTASSSGAILDAWSYTYDATGNRLSKTDLDGKAETYAFDSVDRLTRVNYGDGTSELFNYDPAGNRTSMTTMGGQTINYSYDAANQMLAAGGDTFAWDVRGNLTGRTGSSGAMTLTYDRRNRVTGITGPATETNEYAPTGERSSIASPAVEGTVRPLYDGASNPIVDYDTGNNVWIYRLYGPGMDEPLAEWRRVNNQTTYLHRDGLGSVTAVSDTSGNRLYRQTFTVFGAMSRSAVPSGVIATRFGFTARELSVGSLMQYRARYYDTATGRFTSQDSYRGREADPPSLHRYTYVNNDPVDYTDPTGHFLQYVVPVSLGLIGLGIALAILNAIMYLIYEPCPQFARCLALVSGVFVPAVLAASMFFIWKGGIFGLILGLFIGLFFIYQNNCMFSKWSEQSLPEWKTSQLVCAPNWASQACCQARAFAEQTGFSVCADAVPLVGAALEYWAPIQKRLALASSLCSNC